MKYLALLPILALTLAACSESPEGVGEPELAASVPTLDEFHAANIQNEEPFVGAWRVTSVLLADDQLLPSPDFRYIMTFWGDGTT